MATFTRREWLGGAAATIVAARSARSNSAAAPAEEKGKAMGKRPLDLSEFQPKSMLHVPETKVARSRYPVIDIHTHISGVAKNRNGVSLGEEMRFLAEPADLLQVMDRRNLRMMVDVTGGVGAGLVETVRKYHTPYPDRFAVFTEPWWSRSNEPGYPQFQADQIERAHRAGARGLKILKTLGLYLREQVTTGPLVKVDDRRFDPMWEACGALKMPVAIHTSDPEAFFLPIDRFNERFEELNNHPNWSFYDRDFPSKKELLEARNRVFARHPKTQFVALHAGNDAENLGYVSECMHRLPNMHFELGARISELGRQPRTAAKFFDKYQDRILFGTDAVPPPYGLATPQQVFGDELYEIYFRFLETEDEYFDYAPAPIPPQGRWRIYGLGLPDPILKKVYSANGERLLGLSS
jgi:predicted TIM-barrel fold metal-dependent hydrolase